jgi:hypothetical protein
VDPAVVEEPWNRDAELADPVGLLEGPGALLRHLKLTSLDQLDQPAIRELLITARAHRTATRPQH